MMSAETQPAPRNVGGRPPGLARRRRELTEAFIKELGGPARVTPLQRIEAERCASLTILAEQMRTRALKGEAVDPADLSRLESTWDRAVRRLGIKPSTAAEPVQTLADYLASRHAATDEAEG